MRPKKKPKLKIRRGRSGEYILDIAPALKTPYVPSVDMESPDLYRGTALVTYRLSADRVKEVCGLPAEWSLVDGNAYEENGQTKNDLYGESVPAAAGIEIVFRVAIVGPVRAMEILAGKGAK